MSPKNIHAIITVDSQNSITLSVLKRKLPDLWIEQKTMLLEEK